MRSLSLSSSSPTLRRRALTITITIALGALAFGLAARPAHAQQGFSIAHFSPSPAGDRFFSIPSPYAAGAPLAAAFPLHAALYVDYARDPLVLRGATSGAKIGAIVRDQAIVHLDAAMAIGRRVTLDVDVPLAFQTGSAPSGRGYSFSAPPAAALGDLRLGARFTVLGAYFDPFQLAASFAVLVPTGDQHAYAGDGGGRVAAQLIAGGQTDRLVWTSAAGILAGPRHLFFNVEQGNTLTWGAAAAVRLGDDRTLQIGPELTGTVTLGDIQSRTTSAELLLGARRRFAGNFEVGLGAGLGLSKGVGTPTFRGVGLFAYSPEILDKRPDRDHDGIADSDDACPDVPGDVDGDPKKNGCRARKPALRLDRDFDGVPDADDACPAIPGFPDPDPKKSGCPRPPPDDDGDGVPDLQDACPTIAGPPDRDPLKSGCPATPKDSDGDGVPDARDACPDAPGKASTDPARDGCPGDEDGDGLTDDKDACPAEKGPVTKDPTTSGCPKEVRLTADSIVLIHQVEFDTSTARISRLSAAILDDIAGVLRQHPEITSAEVQGHTDNRGSEKQNTALSQARADAVRGALIKRGIDAARLTAKGYGPTRPAFANLTTEGRQKNRRVEIRILSRTPKQGAP
jgi:outer membrane protein OmpA-like peptidoglycan-associated protein